MPLGCPDRVMSQEILDGRQISIRIQCLRGRTLKYSPRTATAYPWARTGIISYERRIDAFAFYDDLGRNRMIGTPAKPNKALMAKAVEIPNRSESQPINTTTDAVLRNEIIIYNPLAAPRFLPQ